MYAYDIVMSTIPRLVIVNILPRSVAYAGFVQGGGFNHAGSEKADEPGGGGGGGGTPTHFFFVLCVIYIIG